MPENQIKIGGIREASGGIFKTTEREREIRDEELQEKEMG